MDAKDSWLDTAVSGIRFGHDQVEVRAELAGHIEDKAAGLMRVFPGMTEEEALARTLRTMGDPEELKTSLAKVHRPWLGRLWMASQLMLVPVTFIWVIVLFIFALSLLVCLFDWEARQVVFGMRETAWDSETASRSVSVERDASWVQVDDCLLTMERAWLVEDPDQGWELQVGLRLLTPRFWVEEHTFFVHVSAVDSNGTVYAASDTWDWSNRPEHWVSGRMSPQNRSILPHFFLERYILFLGGVDPDAEWVRLEYDRMGRSFSMTVDLKEAGT